MGKPEKFDDDDFVVVDSDDGTTQPFTEIQLLADNQKLHDKEAKERISSQYRRELIREFKRNDGFGTNDSVVANIVKLFSLGMILLGMAALFTIPIQNNPISIDISLPMLGIGCILAVWSLWKKTYRNSLSRFLHRRKNKRAFFMWAKEMRGLLTTKRPFRDEYVAYNYNAFKAALTARGYNEEHIGLLKKMTIQNERFLHGKKIGALAQESNALAKKLQENFHAMERIRTGQVMVQTTPQTLTKIKEYGKLLSSLTGKATELFVPPDR